MLANWFFISLFDVVLTMLKIVLSLDVFFEVIKYLVLPQLEPKHVYVWIIRIVFLYGPPWSIIAESSLDEGAVVSFADIENVIR